MLSTARRLQPFNAARPGPPRAADVLPGAFALRPTEGYAAAAPALTRELDLLLTLDVTAEEAGPGAGSPGGEPARSSPSSCGTPARAIPARDVQGPFAAAVAYAVSAHLFWPLGRHTAVRIRPDGVIIDNVLVRHVIPCQILLFIARRRFYSAPATGNSGWSSPGSPPQAITLTGPGRRPAHNGPYVPGQLAVDLEAGPDRSANYAS